VLGGVSAPPDQKHQKWKNYMKKVFFVLRKAFLYLAFLVEAQMVCDDYSHII